MATASATKELHIGSGKHGTQLASVCCANSMSSHGTCNNLGTKSCKNCKLVAYCSKDCQAQHWPIHKTLCKSELMQPSWSPCWVKELRTPSFMDYGEEFDSTSPMTSPQPLQEERLWGNVPAYGILGSAEGLLVRLPTHLRVCFAASGDLRNVIETVCQIPADFKGEATFYVNDYNAKVMVRNFLMLEMLRVHGSEAIDAVIALWYSIALTSAQLKEIKAVAKRVMKGASEQAFADVYEYSGSVDPSKNGSVVARLRKGSVQVLRLLCENGMSLERAKQTRTAVMKSRPDLVDRRMSCLRLAHRLAWCKFRDVGILLPFFAQTCAETDLHHIKANRFLLTPILGWTIGDGNDPLDGWDFKQLASTGVQCGVPLNDLYGCLFFHLRAKIQSFLDKWRHCQVRFVLSDMEASELAASFRRNKVSLHRIDTSNLADAHFKGIRSVLTDWGPLLASKASSAASSSSGVLASSNVHTVEPLLITYFMNWPLFYNMHRSLSGLHFTQHVHPHERLVNPATTAAEYAKAVRRGMQWGAVRPGFKELAMQMLAGGDANWYVYFHDFSNAFDEYLEGEAAGQAAERAGVQRKQKHVAVPHRLFVGVSESASATPALQGDVEHFYSCNILHFNRTMTERFVEWTLKS